MAGDTSYGAAASGNTPAQYPRAGLTTDARDMASSNSRPATSTEEVGRNTHRGLVDGAVSWYDGDDFVFDYSSQFPRRPSVDGDMPTAI
uniref:Uncharacterized protein n=1 Tax=Peronospora matthiolae TaxID=2874970 RepID=A0AAV1T4Z5_9STRA